MKKKTIKKIIYFTIGLSIFSLLIYVLMCLFPNCFHYSESPTLYEHFHLFIFTLSVVILSLTLLNFIETNTIRDKRILKLEKKDIIKDFSELKEFLSDKKTSDGIYLKDVIIDSTNFREVESIYINWINKFDTFIDTIYDSGLEIDKIINEINTLFDSFKTKFYNKIPSPLQSGSIKTEKKKISEKVKKLNTDA